MERRPQARIRDAKTSMHKDRWGPHTTPMEAPQMFPHTNTRRESQDPPAQKQKQTNRKHKKDCTPRSLGELGMGPRLAQ